MFEENKGQNKMIFFEADLREDFRLQRLLLTALWPLFLTALQSPILGMMTACHRPCRRTLAVVAFIFFL
jgi:hypothetical protein